jgi:hypothetical protein
MIRKDEALGKIFGSNSIVKIMRLLLFHPETPYTLDDISKKVKSPKDSIKKEISDLEKAGLIKKRSFFKKVSVGGGVASGGKKGKKKVEKSKRVSGFIIDEDFHYLSALKKLLIKIPPFSSRELEHQFRGAGPIKLLIISGVFIQEWDTVVDILIVGDRLNSASIDRSIASLESKIGRDLTFALFDTREFDYRVNINDRFIRDILDFPHQKVVNRLGI